MIGYNRVCNIEDFNDPALRSVLDEVYAHERGLYPPDHPQGIADSKQWEVAMAVRALRDFGALRPDARILGVGAGTEITSFHLSRAVHQVVATDIYAAAGPWSDVAPPGFLAAPESFAEVACDPRRILPAHMDGRALNLPDDSFDGVFSSGSIEHFGSLPEVANAAYEIGRVLRPGGIASISTEFKLAGPPDGDGWDKWVILFTPAKLRRYIIEASGLEPVDEPDFTASEATLGVQRDLTGFLQANRAITNPAQKIGVYPNLVLYHEGYVFCSVHLALRKPEGARDNAWAAPDEAMRREVRQARATAAAGLSAGYRADIGSFFAVAAAGPGPGAADPRLAELESQAAEARRQLEWVHASTSWRVTAPLRALTIGLRRLRGN